MTLYHEVQKKKKRKTINGQSTDYYEKQKHMVILHKKVRENCRTGDKKQTKKQEESRCFGVFWDLSAHIVAGYIVTLWLTKLACCELAAVQYNELYVIKHVFI